MGLKARIAARAAARLAEEEAARRVVAEEAAKREAKADARRKRAAVRPEKIKKPANLVAPVAGEPPDQTAAAVAQTDPELFRDAAAREKAAAEINLARKQWAEGPAKVLSR